MTESYTTEQSKRLYAIGFELLREAGAIVAVVRQAIDGRAYLDVKTEHPEALKLHKALVDQIQGLASGLRGMSEGTSDLHSWLDGLRELCTDTAIVAKDPANRADLAQRATALGAGAEDRLARAFSPGGLSPMMVGAFGLTAIAIGYFVQQQTKPQEPRPFEFPKWDFGGETDAEVDGPPVDEDGIIG